jgi:large subunit ribosomal protein L11
MSKKVIQIVKMQILAGQATPAPPIGPALATHGLNISEFCKTFNDKTRELGGARLPIEVTVYDDRSYDLKIKQPLASAMIKKILGLAKGSGTPNRKKVGKMTQSQLTEVAEAKMEDLNANDIEGAKKIIAGTAKSMGVEIEE